MQDIISFLRPAVSRLPNAGIQGCYIVTREHIYARNFGLLAAAPFESDIIFNVPADELDQALNRMQTVTELGFKDGRLLLKAGRLRAAIDTIDAEPPQLQRPSADAQPFPAGLQQAIKTALAFTGDYSPHDGVRLTDGHVAALCNTHGIIIDVPGLRLDGAKLLSHDLAEFIASATPPASFAADQGSIECTWADGKWIVGQLQSGSLGEIPEKALAMVEAQQATVPIDDTWRAALDDMLALSDGMIEINPNGMRGAKGRGDATHEFETGVTGTTHWQASVLQPVFACATAWNPDGWPRALFQGPGLRGIVIGRKG